MDTDKNKFGGSLIELCTSSISELCVEFKRCWIALPNKAIFFVLLAAWLLMFNFLGNCSYGYVETNSLEYWLYNAYMHSTMTEDHGLLIPFVVLVLFWFRRKPLLALKHEIWPPALVLLGFCLLLHLVGYRIQQQRLSVLGFFGGMYALMGLAWGRAFLKASFFPYFLFSFCMPLGALAEPVTFPMRLLVTQIVSVISHVMGMDVIREGTQLFNSSHTYSYEVAAACSGLRSVIAIFCISVIYAFMNFEGLGKRLLLVVAAFPLAIIGNVIRMMSIVVAAEVSGQEFGNFVHENSIISLTPYVPAIFGVMAIGHWLREDPKGPKPPTVDLEAKTV